MSGDRSLLFISSVQREFAAERRAIRDFVAGDPLLKEFFEVFLFEDLPARSQRADRVYLGEAGRCGVYLGLFGRDYGTEDKQGISATEREFDAATAEGRPRFVFLKEVQQRHPKMDRLVRKVDGEVVRKRFSSVSELTAAVYAALVDYLRETGDILSGPFDAAACRRATLDDLDSEAVAQFLRRAKAQRGYALAPDTAVTDVLTHLNLLDRGRPSHAAVLLFGKKPQRFLLTSHVKCLHYHGTEVAKPIPSYQTYTGRVFELIDQAVDFVMSKVNRAIGTRETSAVAPTTYELPVKAVREAIVNAVAHRDYASNASVQVMLFADRLEIWNPGRLPEPLTPDALRKPHSSIPHNPLLAEPLYLAGYIERAGTGTLDMIRLCATAGLPTPEFRQESGFFVQTIRRDRFTPEFVGALDLNPRQQQALVQLRSRARITNAEYRALTGTTKKTATRDFEDLVRKGVVQRFGHTGRGTSYGLAANGDIKGTNGTSRTAAPKRDKKGTKGTSRNPRSRGRAARATKPHRSRAG